MWDFSVFYMSSQRLSLPQEKGHPNQSQLSGQLKGDKSSKQMFQPEIVFLMYFGHNKISVDAQRLSDCLKQSEKHFAWQNITTQHILWGIHN